MTNTKNWLKKEFSPSDYKEIKRLYLSGWRIDDFQNTAEQKRFSFTSLEGVLDL